MASHSAYLPFVSSPVARKRYRSPTTAIVRPSLGIRTVGFVGGFVISISATAWRFSGVERSVRGPFQAVRHCKFAVPPPGGLPNGHPERKPAEVGTTNSN